MASFSQTIKTIKRARDKIVSAQKIRNSESFWEFLLSHTHAFHWELKMMPYRFTAHAHKNVVDVIKWVKLIWSHCSGDVALNFFFYTYKRVGKQWNLIL